MMKKLNDYKQELSEEWNKPKALNIKKEHDKREPRSYEKIKELQTKISEIKKSQ